MGGSPSEPANSATSVERGPEHGARRARPVRGPAQVGRTEHGRMRREIEEDGPRCAVGRPEGEHPDAGVVGTVRCESVGADPVDGDQRPLRRDGDGALVDDRAGEFGDPGDQFVDLLQRARARTARVDRAGPAERGRVAVRGDDQHGQLGVADGEAHRGAQLGGEHVGDPDGVEGQPRQPRLTLLALRRLLEQQQGGLELVMGSDAQRPLARDVAGELPGSGRRDDRRSAPHPELRQGRFRSARAPRARRRRRA